MKPLHQDTATPPPQPTPLYLIRITPKSPRHPMPASVTTDHEAIRIAQELQRLLELDWMRRSYERASGLSRAGQGRGRGRGREKRKDGEVRKWWGKSGWGIERPQVELTVVLWKAAGQGEEKSKTAGA